MNAVIEPQTEQSVQTRLGQEVTCGIVTTLYDLIDAIQSVEGTDDRSVVATMVHLLQSGRITLQDHPITPVLPALASPSLNRAVRCWHPDVSAQARVLACSGS